MKLDPAVLSFDAAGTPYSSVYGDVYHSADSGPGQSRHVFLAGNNLPENWTARRVFTVVETGFGLGLNFLTTWQAWRADPARPGRLHFVSVEKHPFSLVALRVVHERYAGFEALAAELHQAWPVLVPGVHRLHFDDGRVTLTLVFADAIHALSNLRLRADAFFLDGFAPARNGEMWSHRLMKALARLALPGATLATYTSARAVRDALAEAGFIVTKRRGFGRKRDMLTARFEPRWTPRHGPPALPSWPQRHAIVIGAGVAGGAVTERLTARGWHVDLIERGAGPAAETSGLHAAAFQPQISIDDGIPARFTRAGFLYAIACWRALASWGHKFEHQYCGIMRIARDAADEARMAQAVAVHGYPSDYVQFADRAAASLHAGIEVPRGGWWFPQGGWIRPAALVAAQLDAARASYTQASVNPHFGKQVRALRRDGDHWQALAVDGSVIATAPVVILANAGDALFLADIMQPLQRIRGQLTHLPAATAPLPRTVVTGDCYLLPAVGGITVTGASYDIADGDMEMRATDHAENLDRLARLLNRSLPPGTAMSGGSVGFRCVAPDRLPLIGALPDVVAAYERRADLAGAHLEDLPRLQGLYGAFAYASRGLAWAALGGELIASLLEGEPPPLEQDLVDAVDPARFVLKHARSGTL